MHTVHFLVAASATPPHTSLLTRARCDRSIARPRLARRQPARSSVDDNDAMNDGFLSTPSRSRPGATPRARARARCPPPPPASRAHATRARARARHARRLARARAHGPTEAQNLPLRLLRLHKRRTARHRARRAAHPPRARARGRHSRPLARRAHRRRPDARAALLRRPDRTGDLTAAAQPQQATGSTPRPDGPK